MIPLIFIGLLLSLQCRPAPAHACALAASNRSKPPPEEPSGDQAMNNAPWALSQNELQVSGVNGIYAKYYSMDK